MIYFSIGDRFAQRDSINSKDSGRSVSPRSRVAPVSLADRDLFFRGRHGMAGAGVNAGSSRPVDED